MTDTSSLMSIARTSVGARDNVGDADGVSVSGTSVGLVVGLGVSGASVGLDVSEVHDLFGQNCLSCALGKDFEELQGTRLHHDFWQPFCHGCICNDNGENGSGATTSSWTNVTVFCGRAESLVMLVNEFVLSTELAVQNHRANYSVRKLTAATIITLIFQPAISQSVTPCF